MPRKSDSDKPQRLCPKIWHSLQSVILLSLIMSGKVNYSNTTSS